MARWRFQVGRIVDLNAKYELLNDPDLRKESLSLRYEALSGRPLDQLLPQAFALTREASKRTLGMTHYDVQLMGGIAMHHGSIAVMQTGEGKTLTATLPLYLAALTGKGAHLATANDYLAARDAESMKPIFECLGFRVGTVCSDTPGPERKRAYGCDITYTTAKEVGFDFLRDRLHKRHEQLQGPNFVSSMVDVGSGSNQSEIVQRELNFMLVDEADSILIDEARTPLIISSMPDEIAQAKTELFRWAYEVVGRFKEDEHFELDKKTRQVTLTAVGRRLVRKLPQPKLLSRTPTLDIYDQVEQAILVEETYVRDRQYVVRDGEIVIVDEYTGRLAEGRKWRDGLHQAIEAREGLEISVETGESARITVQDLFLRYERLCGMTGTAANSAQELRNIYEVKVIDIPTHRPPRRIRWPDLVFGTAKKKWEAIADEIYDVTQVGRPVLVGTRSIDKSELLSRILNERNIEHKVLNARHLAAEAEIISEAGQVGRVTVATNMAGRGTDIRVSQPALEIGGLHVICSELHDSARIDRQLIGRCGRQGDPGTFRQFVSLDDDILRAGLGNQAAKRLLKKKHLNPEILARLSALFQKAQSRIEKRHFKARKMLLYHEKLRQEMQQEMGQDPYLDTAGA